MENVKREIESLANSYSRMLNNKIGERKKEMDSDNNSHYTLYNLLGINDEYGYEIDLYQNVGRFLYKYAGAFIEEAATICFKHKYPDARKLNIPNTIDNKPKTFEIDCLVGNHAFEIKWRDATTDGDHVSKEHKRVKVIKDAGYIPVRIMFYAPNRVQSIRIQRRLKELYESDDIKGHYYAEEDAWNFIKNKTGVDLKQIVEELSNR